MGNQINTSEKKVFKIDIEKILSAKSPRLAKYIPGFVIRFLKRLLHQDEINQALETGADLRDAAFADYAISCLGATFEALGAENIPKTGGAIVASNHPLGALDGMALLVEATKIRPDTKFIVNDILMSLPNFEKQFIPVNKLGASARDSLKLVEKTYASGELILIFPAGICSRKTSGIIHDLEWSKSFLSRAIKYNLPVIPTFITGQNSKRFYRIANFRRMLGLKVNLEMMTLSDEMFMQKGNHLFIIFDKPVPASFFTKRYSLSQWAYLLREFVYTIPNKNKLPFESFVDTIEPK